MEISSKQKGNLTELQCIAACYELGYSVSIPYGENSRYDFILDVCGKLLKIQVKTCRHKKGASNPVDCISFSCRSTNVNTKMTKYSRYTKEEIDYFATYWNNCCYLIPIEECSVEKTLWFNPPQNSQKKYISMASDYELSKMIQKELHSL